MDVLEIPNSQAIDGVGSSDAPAPQPIAARLGESLGLPNFPVRRALATAMARGTRIALYNREFERSVMVPSRPLLERLAALAQMQAEVLASSLLSRDRIDIADELDRYGMRLLWRSQLVETLSGHSAPLEVRAAALLELIARRALPLGSCSRQALDAAKALLASEAMAPILRDSPNVRTDLLARLLAAEAYARTETVALQDV